MWSPPPCGPWRTGRSSRTSSQRSWTTFSRKGNEALRPKERWTAKKPFSSVARGVRKTNEISHIPTRRYGSDGHLQLHCPRQSRGGGTIGRAHPSGGSVSRPISGSWAYPRGCTRQTVSFPRRRQLRYCLPCRGQGTYRGSCAARGAGFPEVV